MRSGACPRALRTIDNLLASRAEVKSRRTSCPDRPRDAYETVGPHRRILCPSRHRFHAEFAARRRARRNAFPSIWSTGRIIDSAVRIHGTSGPGLVESVYEWCWSRTSFAASRRIPCLTPECLRTKSAGARPGGGRDRDGGTSGSPTARPGLDQLSTNPLEASDRADHERIGGGSPRPPLPRVLRVKRCRTDLPTRGCLTRTYRSCDTSLHDISCEHAYRCDAHKEGRQATSTARDAGKDANGMVRG